MTDGTRIPDRSVDTVFIERWSPRAFAPDTIAEEELLGLFEAARWAPSSYNSQPWRFIYGRRGTPAFDTLLGLLNTSNRSWARFSSALVFIVSTSVMTPPGQEHEVPLRSHSFDAGAAWMSFALQAFMRGWYTHGMAGLDFERAFVELGVPRGYRIETAIAVGRIGDKTSLPERLQAREQPSPRQPVSAFAMEGGFKA